MTSALKNNLMAMGWYMRRTPDSHSLGTFYADVMGLPLIRGGAPWPVTMFWAGDAIIFELKSDEVPSAVRETDPATASCVPVFRVHGLDPLLARLKAVETIGRSDDAHSREAFILDTDDQLICLREADSVSPLPHDQEAKRRLDTGLTFNPGCAPMPDDIQALDMVRFRVNDLDAMTRFYRDIIGLSLFHSDEGTSLFDLGDNTTLELRPGGAPVPLPADRVEVPNSFILRLHNTERFKTHVKAQGVHFVNEHIQWKRAHLAYFADPESRIIGIEERYEPENYLEPVESYDEDLEAERRFRQAQ